jgi:pimeloyl-ACP methyl ester carboxylesterase
MRMFVTSVEIADGIKSTHRVPNEERMTSDRLGPTLSNERGIAAELFQDRYIQDRYINVGTFRTRYWKAGSVGSTTREFVGTRYALASEPGAQQAVLRTLRGFVSFGGFRRGQIAALQAAMPTMKQPALIIWGRQDKLVPADHARILEGKLPRASTILFDNCGHFPQVEQPQRFNTAVLDFLRGVQEPQ